MRIILNIVLASSLPLAAGCGSTPPEPPPAARTLSPLAQVGERIFKDTSLSASGQMACATCHDEAHAFTPANGLPVQLGGAGLDLAGTRQAPAIRYLTLSGPFRFEADGTPAGGFFWDGRAASLAAQAAGPFLNPVEMAMPSKEAVVEQLAAAPYAGELRALFGDGVFDDVDGAYLRMTLAIEAYEREDVAFAPYTSKYDAFLRGEARLSDRELRGLALFNAPTKGNCAACHPSKASPGGAPPLFTDFTYDALGVPRNPAIPANADPAHFDLGLCGRPELADRKDLCGAFKVPSLRNVAQRKVFFHNARFTSLEDVLHFYVERDTSPEKFYPPDGQGGVKKFDDLPPELHRNVNVSEPPYDRRPGQPPALDDAEIADVIEFLKTLDDGFTTP
ncbi:MAG: cytochrome c peroxidase [Anaeromyxobacteraceae bacterium]